MVHDPDAGSVYCVLDGLDECNETASELLLQRLKTLLTKPSDFSPCYLHVIVASRDLPEVIPEVLSSFPRIRLDGDAASDVNVDIRNFVDVKINELSRYRNYPPFLRDKIKKTFQDRANGTFLWVGIVAQALRKYKASEAEKALDLFPSGLDEIYARLLLQVEVKRREMVAKILRWVVMAVRPLTLSELSAALQLEKEYSINFGREEVMKDQISHCGYLFTLENGKVSLIHQSVKDYLLGGTLVSRAELSLFDVDQPSANLEIARACLQNLHDGALAEDITYHEDLMNHEKVFPMLPYAIYHWPDHAKTLTRSKDIFDLSLPFYERNSQVRRFWLKSYKGLRGYYEVTDDPSSLLHIASAFDIGPLVENLLSCKGPLQFFRRMFYVNWEDRSGLTALDYAVRNGHKATVSLLLKKGARLRNATRSTESALDVAAAYGHEAILCLLLEEGPRAGVTDEQRSHALACAASVGDVTFCEIILADLEKSRGNLLFKNQAKARALEVAAASGSSAVVRLLFDHGTSVDFKGWRLVTLFVRAAQEGNTAMIRSFLDNGMDINAKDDTKWTALNEAALHGKEQVIRLLLTRKVDLEARPSDKGGTALHTAASRGFPRIVQSLLEAGANIKAQCGPENTALDLAYICSLDAFKPRADCERVMQLLITQEEEQLTLSERSHTYRAAAQYCEERHQLRDNLALLRLTLE